MRRFVTALLLLLPWMATAAVHADPLFDFKISGDGHVFEFAGPNPAPVYDHPHNVDAFVSASGTEDGVGGYSFGVLVEVAFRGGFGSNFSFSGGPAGSGTGFTYDLSGPPITSVVSMPVSYNPIYQGPGYQDRLISSFLPGDYGFYGFVGVDRNIENFDVLVTEESGPVVTPEPATWMLLATGAAGAVASLRRRRASVCRGNAG